MLNVQSSMSVSFAILEIYDCEVYNSERLKFYKTFEFLQMTKVFRILSVEFME